MTSSGSRWYPADVGIAQPFEIIWQVGVNGGFVGFEWIYDINAAVTPRLVALMCVQRVVTFCHMSSHTQHGQRTLLSRFANVVHVWRTFYHVLIRSHPLDYDKTEHAQFSRASVWDACEWTRCSTFEVRSKSAGYTSNKFLGRSSLVAHAVDIRTPAKIIKSIIKRGIKLLIHSQTVQCITFSRQFYSAYECVQSLGMVTIIPKYWIWNHFHI